ncbi:MULTISPECIES: aldo/keto reductase [Streptomyces]|uniref:Aldo/keto reductase n=1 Tax=Streptomyces dengpaensis TaxID=2049881 RepID=A0ABN5IGH9_9ACTN|nr:MULTISPECIES: aldo/keto reductase [Streptomyces]AVH61537.1 aldo/keto reductase [Streptomyces dengpaensis]PIB05887.1 aldo/keto reductase [Streptomyces sp. HG99]
MERRYLGATGMSVSATALGTANFGPPTNTDRAETVGMIRTAIEAGINVIDTSDGYGDGEVEMIVGEAIQDHRDDVVLATKFGAPFVDDPNRQGASPRWVRRAVEASLRRLRTDHIDLFQLARYDWNTGLDETLSALTDLQSAGLIRAFGHSSFPVEKIVEAQWVAERRGHARFATEQARYSILHRELETAVLPTAQRYGMGVLSYGPLANGWLSGRALAENLRAKFDPSMFDTTDPANARCAELVAELAKVAEAAGIPLPHMATAFTRTHPAITSVIIGPRTPHQLQDQIAASDLVLTDDLLDAIDAIVAPGTEVIPGDTSIYRTSPPSITDPAQRRRHGQRSSKT